MRFVYAVGFLEGEFLMIYNPRREGWEMPGGHMEGGESPEEAIRREYLEESGFEFLPLARMDMGEVAVFAGLIEHRGKGEMRGAFFSELPERLAFPEVEYREIISWARTCLEKGEGRNIRSD
jgi:8-oxo-dGTP diphosphatase